MGIDAYSITAQGRRPDCATVGNRRELVDARLQRAFEKAATTVAKAGNGVDADLHTGSLGISANASAVHHLLHAYGAVPSESEETRYSPSQVALAGSQLFHGEGPRDIPEYIVEDKSAMLHATEFIRACWLSGLGIEISP